MAINVGQELLNVPMGALIKSMALAIAQGQWELDKSSMTVAELMSGHRILRDIDTGKLVDASNKPLPEGSAPIIVDSRVDFGYTYATDPKAANKIIKKHDKLSMIELGFTPVFYQFVDTTIEVKIAVTSHGEAESTTNQHTVTNTTTNSYDYSSSSSWWYYGRYHSRASYQTETRASTVDAKYSSKYSYDIHGASSIKTKLVPIPPPAILEERIRQVMEDEKIWEAAILGGIIKVADDNEGKGEGTVEESKKNDLPPKLRELLPKDI